MLVARSWRAGLRPTSRMLVQAVLGHPLSLALQGAAAPLFLGVATKDPRLVNAAAQALDWAGLPGGTAEHAGPIDVALRLRRHWSIAT